MGNADAAFSCVHLGAKSALLARGYGHSIPISRQTIYLVGSPGTRLPKWFSKHDWGVSLVYNTSSLFVQDERTGIEEREQKGLILRISSPERAIMEVLDRVPYADSIDEATDLMNGLTALRPAHLEKLMQSCRSVKVKRLFLYLAENSGHAWVNKLSLTEIDLGSGARQIVPGGVLDSRYKITVPRSPEIP